jgi:hypothetical protein
MECLRLLIEGTGRLAAGGSQPFVAAAGGTDGAGKGAGLDAVRALGATGTGGDIFAGGGEATYDGGLGGAKV